MLLKGLKKNRSLQEEVYFSGLKGHFSLQIWFIVWKERNVWVGCFFFLRQESNLCAKPAEAAPFFLVQEGEEMGICNPQGCQDGNSFPIWLQYVKCAYFKPGPFQLLPPVVQHPNLGEKKTPTFVWIDILQMTIWSTLVPPPYQCEDNIHFQLVAAILVRFSFYSLTIFVLLKSCSVINEILQFC